MCKCRGYFWARPVCSFTLPCCHSCHRICKTKLVASGNMSCRPEPEEADLATTATTIWHAAHSTAPDAAQERILSSVAAAYYQHYCTQSRPDFHGLRDFYAVISTLRLQPQLSPAQLYKALLRNFGGPAEQVQQVRDGSLSMGARAAAK